jgi:uncharacterized FAD-dependent dehydrogenase
MVIELTLLPELLPDKENLYIAASRQLKLNRKEIKAVVPTRRSIDARSRQPVFKIRAEVYVNELPIEEPPVVFNPVKSNKKVLIVGSGPGGLFAALRLIELGLKPVIIERGKDVRTRRRDIRTLQQLHIVNPDSNYCFGEGGAGTYSDGKLYTRATKRGDVKKILRILVQHNAHPDILIDAHPHIGSNKLPKVVEAIRKTIIDCGGEIHFNSRVTDFSVNNGKIVAVIVNNADEIPGDALILAAGHSARDIFYLLHKKNIRIEPKPFAMGVRIEHPQKMIDNIQYHTENRGHYLPAASYSLTCEIDKRGIYSFCMCPGGMIVPAATEPGEIVVNGMSLSKRNSPFANAGLVVTVDERDWDKYQSFYPFSGLILQQKLEQTAFQIANQTQSAPAQRLTDFVKNKVSESLPSASYIPGLTPAPLHEFLPKFVSSYIKKALIIFDKKLKGYYSAEAVITAPESRTSSPIRILRDKNTLMHPDVEGLFPCGEGAGYAGGIVSAAFDGVKCADACAKYLRV